MDPKYAITLSSFRDLEPLDRTLERISAIGFDAVEIYGEPGLLEPRELSELFATYQTRVCGVTGMWGSRNCLGRDRQLLASDRAKQKQAEKYVKDCVRLCAALGGKHLNLCLFADTEPSIYSKTHRTVSSDTKERMYSSVTPSLKALASFAQDHSVNLLLEPLNRYSTPYCSTARDARTLTKKVDRENFRMMLDTFHMNIEEDSFENAIESSKNALRHIHLADNNRKMPGNAHINFGAIMKALSGIGYSGFMTFEPTIPSSENYEIALQRGLSFVKSLYSTKLV